MSVSKLILSSWLVVFQIFLLFKNGKKGQNFQFGEEKRVQNGKKGQNFHFGNKKRVQNGKNS